MSTPEPQSESRSSVKLVRNAKGETQIEVKTYVGDDAADIEYAKQQAIQLYNSLCGTYKT